MKKLITSLAIAACCFYSCKHKTTNLRADPKDTANASNTQRNKQTALASERAFASRDVEAAYKDCAIDFTDYGSGESAPVKNIDTLKAGLKSYLNAFPDLKVKNIKAMAEGDSVMISAEVSGTFKNEYMGIKPTGKSFKINDADIFTFNNAGKITSHRSTQSYITFFTQLGIPLPSDKK